MLLVAFMLISSGCIGKLAGESADENTEQRFTEAPAPESDQQTYKESPPESAMVPIEIDLAEGNEYFAYALYAFTRRASGDVMAVLHDIDGCGNVEMILLDTGVPEEVEHWAAVANGFEIAVFDAKKADEGPASIILDGVTYNTYMTYLTERNEIVVFDVFEGSSYRVIRYNNGTLSQEAELVDGSYAGESYYGVNGKESGKRKYQDKLNEYGVEQISVGIGKGSLCNEPISLKDDFSKILDMQSFKTASSSANTVGNADAGLTEEAYYILKPHIERMVYLYMEANNESGIDLYEHLTSDFIQSYAYMICADLEPMVRNNGLAAAGLSKGDAFIRGGEIHVPVSYVRTKLLSAFGEDALRWCNVDADNIFEYYAINNGRYVCYLGDGPLMDFQILEPEKFPVLIEGNEIIRLKANVERLIWDDENETEYWVENSYSLNVGVQPDEDSEFGYNIVSFIMIHAG